MMTALIGALLILIVGSAAGGNSFDLHDPSEFRKSKEILREVIVNTEREEEVIEVIEELRDIEKEEMKALNKKYKNLQGKDWGFDVDFDKWHDEFDKISARSREVRWTSIDLLGKWKSLMTEEEWELFIQKLEQQ